MEDFSAQRTKISAARNMDDIARVNHYYKPFRAAYIDLSSMAKSAGNRLTAAMEKVSKSEQDEKDSFTRSKAKAKSATAKGLNGTGASNAKASTIDMAFEVAKQIEATALLSGQGHVTKFLGGGEIPHCFRVDPNDPIMSVDASGMMKQVRAFADRFAVGPERADPGRSQRRLTPEIASEVQTFFEGILPEAHMMRPVDPPAELRKLVSPVIFTVAKNRETCSAEPGHLTSMRLVIAGSRKIVAFNTVALLGYLVDVLKMPEVTLKSAYDWIKMCNPDSVKALLRHYDDQDIVFGLTQGAGDLLFLPAGWTFCEKMSNANVAGVKLQLISKKDEKQLQGMQTFLMSGTPQPNAALQMAVDHLTIVGS